MWLFCGFQKLRRDEEPCFQRESQEGRLEEVLGACREGGFQPELRVILIMSGQGPMGLIRFPKWTQAVDTSKDVSKQDIEKFRGKKNNLRIFFDSGKKKCHLKSFSRICNSRFLYTKSSSTLVFFLDAKF